MLQEQFCSKFLPLESWLVMGDNWVQITQAPWSYQRVLDATYAGPSGPILCLVWENMSECGKNVGQPSDILFFHSLRKGWSSQYFHWGCRRVPHTKFSKWFGHIVIHKSVRIPRKMLRGKLSCHVKMVVFRPHVGPGVSSHVLHLKILIFLLCVCGSVEQWHISNPSTSKTLPETFLTSWLHQSILHKYSHDQRAMKHSSQQHNFQSPISTSTSACSSPKFQKWHVNK